MLNELLAACLRWLVRRVLNPAILWCYGWECERTWAHGIQFEAWVDPADGRRYGLERAIERCESRITDGG